MCRSAGSRSPYVAETAQYRLVSSAEHHAAVLHDLESRDHEERRQGVCLLEETSRSTTAGSGVGRRKGAAGSAGRRQVRSICACRGRAARHRQGLQSARRSPRPSTCSPASGSEPGSDVVPVGGSAQRSHRRLVLRRCSLPAGLRLRQQLAIGMHFFALSNTIEFAASSAARPVGRRSDSRARRRKIFDGLQFGSSTKIGDSVGMYQVTLQLPDSMRYLQFGAVTVILPS